MLVGNLLFNLAQWFFAYGVPFVAVLQMVMYYTPYLLVLSLPVGTAVAVALTVNRLTRDSEITVIRMAGISLRRIFRPLILLGLIMSALNFWLNERVVPESMKQFNQLKNRMFLMQPVPNLASNVVIKVQNYTVSIDMAQQRGNRVYLKDVLLIQKEARGGWIVTLAPEAVYDEGLWVLTKATVHYYQPNGQVAEVRKSDRAIINLRVAVEDFFATPMPEELTRAQLKQQIERGRQTGSNTRSLEVTYHMKLALPVACLVLAICCPVLSLWFARAGSFVGVLLAIVLVFVFWNTLLLFQLLGNQGFLTPILSAWSPNLLFGAVGFYLLWRSE
jgi:lipopolysaccharide export system permease protein